MMSGVHIFCFASCYAIALLLEFTRLLFRSRWRGLALAGFAAAGLLAHTIYLYYRAVHHSGVPLSSNQDWCLLTAWVLAAVYLYGLYFQRRTPFGLAILPLILGLIAAASLLASPQPYARDPALKIWGVVHGASLVLATAALLLGFGAGLGYLGQRYRLKHRHAAARVFRLPSLEWLQRANSHAVLAAVFLLGVGIVSGMILNANRGAAFERLPWNDPVVLSTMAMFAWLVIAVILGNFRAHGRRVAYLTIASFVVLLIALAMVLLSNTQHGRKRSEGVPSPSGRGPG